MASFNHLANPSVLLCLSHDSLSLRGLQDSGRFGQHIRKAMLDIQGLFKPDNDKKTVEHGKPVQLENGKKHL